MSAGNAAHNASKIALTRAAASSPPPSGTTMHATLLNATLQTLTVAGAQPRPQPKRLGAEPDRMRASDGQNTGEPGSSKADDVSARARMRAGRRCSFSPAPPAADWPERRNRPRALHHETAAARTFVADAAPTRLR